MRFMHPKVAIALSKDERKDPVVTHMYFDTMYRGKNIALIMKLKNGMNLTIISIRINIRKYHIKIKNMPFLLIMLDLIFYIIMAEFIWIQM